MHKNLVTGLLLGILLSGCANQPGGSAKLVPATRSGAKSPEPEAADDARNASTSATRKPAAVPSLGKARPRDINPEPATSPNQAVKSGNLWKELGDGQLFADDIKHQRVNSQMRVYLRHKTRLAQQLSEAELYLPYITEQLRQKRLPLELALLPMIESAYDPFAYSSSGAAGLWQFIPTTADHIGLERNWWYDGRRDIISSTEAALEYLRYLNQRFSGDWLLTLAAYNAGEGTVTRAVENNQRRGRDASFWALNLPEQTRVYVPRFLALARIIADPGQHKLELSTLSKEISFEPIRLPHSMDLQRAAFLADMDVETLYRLNPGYLRSVTPPARPYNLVLPKESTSVFKARLATTPPAKQADRQTHIVETGDTLSAIARQYHISINSLIAVNRLQSTLIKVGQALEVPTALTASPSNQHRTGTKATLTAKPRRYKLYQVRKGDTLAAIAGKHGVSVSKLVLWNQWPRSKSLMPGHELVVGYDFVSSGDATVSYDVRAGDSLYKIAKKFKVAVNDIVQWNDLNKSSTLQPGQRLLLYPSS